MATHGVHGLVSAACLTPTEGMPTPRSRSSLVLCSVQLDGSLRFHTFETSLRALRQVSLPSSHVLTSLRRQEFALYVRVFVAGRGAKPT
ncbi:hypothetical protein BD311DRAFT_764733 [Dichomitus squalens]|uniref:Uncharacterized protein n=1 Tax=Dichomitus squalens TaxID=114155 RepID=A0A4Q9MHM4_9APHY|nr:hypothetical protein BD311DRAFT_764733 [Dichomitus squalens]